MRYFRIKNWEKFQHYKHRNPPWIKLHVSFLDDWEIANLSARSQILLIRLWLVASRTQNVLHNEQRWLRFHTSLRRHISLKPLEKADLIEYIDSDASTTLATCMQSADSESETEGKTEKRRSREELSNAELRHRQTSYDTDDFEKKRKKALEQVKFLRDSVDKMKTI